MKTFYRNLALGLTIFIGVIYLGHSVKAATAGVPITVPSATTTGYMLTSDTNGRYVATSTENLTVGRITATSSTASTFVNLTVSGTCTGCAAGSSINYNPFTAASFVATSTATSTFVGGLYARLVSAPYFHATSTTATSTFAGPLDVTSTATSTFANGIEITGGCYKKQGQCLTEISSALSGILQETGGLVSTIIVGSSLDYTGTTLSVGTVAIGDGGTNATSFGTTNGITYYDGTRLVTDADLTFTNGNLLTATYASSTSLTTTGYVALATAGGFAGVGTTTPSKTFSVQGDSLVSGTATAGNIVATSTLTVNSQKTTGERYIVFGLASSTAFAQAGGATTTVFRTPAGAAQTWNTVTCDFDSFVRVLVYDASGNRMNDFVASSTIGTVTFTANNSFILDEGRRVDIGTTTNVARVTGGCTAKATLN